MKNDRFKLTDEVIKLKLNLYRPHDVSHILHRIEALIDMPDINVKKGDKGGFIEKEENLTGNAWVYDEAKVFDNAVISDNAIIKENGVVSGNARVYDNAVISGCAHVKGNTKVHGNTKMYDNSIVDDCAELDGNTVLYDNADVFGNCNIYSSILRKNVRLRGKIIKLNNATLYGDLKVCGEVCIIDSVVSDNSCRSYNFSNCLDGSDLPYSGEINSKFGPVVIFDGKYKQRGEFNPWSSISKLR